MPGLTRYVIPDDPAYGMALDGMGGCWIIDPGHPLMQSDGLLPGALEAIAAGRLVPESHDPIHVSPAWRTVQ